MKLLACILALGCCTALADEPVKLQAQGRRAWLTGVGLGLGGAGAIVLSVGAYQAAQAEAAGRAVAAYYANGAAPTAGEASTVRWLQERSDSAGTRALALLIGGGIAAALGVGLVLLDGWFVQAEVSVAVQPSGGSVILSARF